MPAARRYATAGWNLGNLCRLDREGGQDPVESVLGKLLEQRDMNRNEISPGREMPLSKRFQPGEAVGVESECQDQGHPERRPRRSGRDGLGHEAIAAQHLPNGFSKAASQKKLSSSAAPTPELAGAARQAAVEAV